MLRILPSGLRWLTWPFSLLYQFITTVRNAIFDAEFRSIYQSTIYTISIGNLTIGGTGKTPHIEYLLRLLANRYTLATLSRGYGRKSKGFLQAKMSSSAAEIGDEPLQLFKKFGANVPVFVAEKRAEGLKKIEQLSPCPQLVLLDDAYQHRAVKPHLSLLLTDYGRLFYQDYVLPLGLLRESRQGAKRAQGVVVTKCPPTLTPHERGQIEKKIQQYTLANTPIFFSYFEYGTPVPYFDDQPPLSTDATLWLVSGIAQPKLFEEAARNRFKVTGHSAVGDHHDFTKEEVKKWVKLNDNHPILTTEKDWVKLKPLLEELGLAHSCFYYWPIQVAFFDTRFDNFLLSEVAKQRPVW